MIYFRIMLLTLLFSSNCFCGNNMSTKFVSPAYVEMAVKIRSETANKLAKSHNMKIFGSGGGMADCVNLLELAFQIQGPLTKEQLRRILVDSVQVLLNAVNSDEQIRPFLKNYPFTNKEIIITLYVKDKTGEKVYDPEIAIASSWQGTINYNTKDKKASVGYKQEIEEDYETALKIVLEENKK